MLAYARGEVAPVPNRSAIRRAVRLLPYRAALWQTTRIIRHINRV